MYGKLGGYRWQENLMIYLAPEGGLCFPFDQASSLQDCELSEEGLLLEEELSFANLFFPTCQVRVSGF
jgi:hypothetical protein